MATAEQIAELRRKISEPDTTTYTDQALSDLIDAASDDVNLVASGIWEEKAALYSEMVDISEAGSSRKNSQLSKNALEQARYYAEQSGGGDAEVVSERPRTRRIVRA